MKKLLPVFILIVVSSCATVNISSDFDKSASFPGYKTYALTPEALNLNINELNRNRLITAVEKELRIKGFTKSENPDVLIDIKITGEKKQTTTATSSGGYGMYGWGGGMGTTTINYDSYVEGTLFVEMVDAARKQLVWLGWEVGTIDPEASAEQREKNINNAVKQIFTNYPPKLK
jgi:hypothetical protein